jgi:osomolarity two-component system sensor histidine kinase NIK1
MSTMTDSYQQGLSHPFLSHLIALLSAYELCPMSTPPPRYDGPTDWQTDTILRSLGAVARRMYTAEETLTSIKASECWQTNGPETKKRRSVGNTPISSSCSSQKETDPPSSLLKQSSTVINAFAMSPGSNSHFPSTSPSTPAAASADVDVDMSVADSVDDAIDGDRTPAGNKPYSSRANAMSLSLDGIDAATLLRSFHNGSSASAPSTTHIEHVACPTCGKAITDTLTMSRINGSFSGSHSGSPLVVPPGPLVAAAFESGMSAVEELRLLKAQVQDVARVCNAVARGDLSQKITVTVQGVVMVQLKDVINTMVFFFSFTQGARSCTLSGRQIGAIRQRGYSCQSGSRYRRVT